MDAKNLLDQYFETAFTAPDGIKRLRELILTLAMRGQLIPQDPADQPARELLGEIEAEKQELIKAGKLKKSRPLPPIKPEEIPYELPQSWEWVRLGDIGESNIGLTYKPSDLSDSGIPVLRSSNIQKGKLDLLDLKRVKIEKIKESAFVQDGDLLICARNGSKELVGKTALIENLSERMTFGAFMAIFRSRFNNYLLRFINSSLFKEMISDVTTTTINQITQNNLKSTVFPLPPLAEQKRLVEKIDRLMEQCDQLEQLGAVREQKRILIHTSAREKLLKAFDQETFGQAWAFIQENFGELYAVKENVTSLRQAILQLAVMGKLVPQDPNDPPASELLKEIEAEKHRLIKEGKLKKQKPLPEITAAEIPYDLPNGWKWVRIRNICHDWGQKQPDKKFTYIDVSCIDNKNGVVSNDFQLLRPDEAPSRARKIVKKGTVIYSTVRPYLLNVAIVNQEYEYEAIASTAFAILHPFLEISNRFIYLYLRSPIFVKYVEDQMKGVAYPAINDGSFFQGLIPLPPLPEQRRIVAKVDALTALCDRLENQIDQQTAKQTQLLDAVMAGI